MYFICFSKNLKYYLFVNNVINIFVQKKGIKYLQYKLELYIFTRKIIKKLYEKITCISHLPLRFNGC